MALYNLIDVAEFERLRGSNVSILLGAVDISTILTEMSTAPGRVKLIKLWSSRVYLIIIKSNSPVQCPSSSI